MRILITGCKGQLGREISRRLGAAGRDTVIAVGIQELDISRLQHVLGGVDSFKPDIIINCAAMTNIDLCETDEDSAFKVNALGARNLSVAAYRVGAKIVHISSDCVFDGTGGTPLKEYDSINPINCYGRSKALGEAFVKETNPRHFILRTGWLYGEGRNFINELLKQARPKAKIEVAADQTGTPTSTADLALCITNLMYDEGYGIYHATCEGYCSLHAFAGKILKLVGSSARVTQVTSANQKTIAKRPGFTVLDNYMLKLAGQNTFRHWEEALEKHIRNYYE